MVFDTLTFEIWEESEKEQKSSKRCCKEKGGRLKGSKIKESNQMVRRVEGMTHTPLKRIFNGDKNQKMVRNDRRLLRDDEGEHLRGKRSSTRVRPYHVESTPSRPIWQVKQRWARLVLGSETAWESRVS